MDKGKMGALAALVAVALFFAGFKLGQGGYFDTSRDAGIEIEAAGSGTAPQASPAPVQEIWVYVVGAVKSPGVVKLPAGSRVFQAVDLASPLAEADVSQLEMARPLVDGEKITVPRMGEKLPETQATAATTVKSATSTRGGLININTASASEMDQALTGIGPALAERIVEYRTANGPFTSIDQIKDVSGIGDKKFAAIKDSITVGP